MPDGGSKVTREANERIKAFSFSLCFSFSFPPCAASPRVGRHARQTCKSPQTAVSYRLCIPLHFALSTFAYLPLFGRALVACLSSQRPVSLALLLRHFLVGRELCSRATRSLSSLSISSPLIIRHRMDFHSRDLRNSRPPANDCGLAINRYVRARGRRKPFKSAF